MLYMTRSLADFPEVPVPGVNIPWGSVADRVRYAGQAPTPKFSVTHEADVTAQAVVDALLDLGAETFPDNLGEYYCWLPVDQHWECLPLLSKQFMGRLARFIRSRFGRSDSKRMLKQVVELLELDAICNDGKELGLRFHRDSDEFRIDIGDHEWNQIVVDRSGWRIEPQDRPRFRRKAHMQRIQIPVANGNYELLFDLLPRVFRQRMLLTLTWMLSPLLNRFSIPILLLVGPKGSMKTTASRCIRYILDPSAIDSLSKTDTASLDRAFSNHAVPIFENVGSFSSKTSDEFCRAVTGAGFERRRQYTVDESFLIAYRRPIIVNGIDIPSQNTDFIGRCVFVQCAKSEDYRTEEEVYGTLESQAPSILGGLLDLAARVIAVRPSVRTTGADRMADFIQLGRAVAIALGRTEAEFDAEIEVNKQARSSAFTDSNSIAYLLVSFAEQFSAEQPWSGSASELYQELKKFARDNESIGCEAGRIPGVMALKRKLLKDYADTLKEAGASYDWHRTSGMRKWTVSRCR